ncbi:MAG: hypothetical protein KatS3mg095_0061 [Candidatus Parcubacteria bacterium]|nr:MAG: hypothetical protein KatS3mg095_0061 [Candidatus Parcubacteria bacterium]
MVKKKLTNKKLKFIKNLIILIIIVLILFIKFNLEIDGNYKKTIYLGEYLLTKYKIIKDMFNNYPELINIKTIISITERKIKLKTITENPVAKICYQNSCYFLGEHSYIYKPKNQKTYNLLLINSEIPILDNSFLENNITNALAKVFEYSNTRNFYLTKIDILSNKDLKIYSNNFSFLIDPNKNIDNQIKKLNYFLSNYKDDNLKLKEVDLRISNRIYYKLKQ